MSVNTERSPFRTVEHRVDLCVGGGGMAGICAAVAAARHGAMVVLVQPTRKVVTWGGDRNEPVTVDGMTLTVPVERHNYRLLIIARQ